MRLTNQKNFKQLVEAVNCINDLSKNAGIMLCPEVHLHNVSQKFTELTKKWQTEDYIALSKEVSLNRVMGIDSFLFCGLIDNKNLEPFQRAEEFGLNPLNTTSDGYQLAKYATIKKGLRFLQYLYSKGVRIHKNYCLILHIAAESGDLKIVRWLHENGGEIFSRGSRALLRAVENHRADVALYLAQQGCPLTEAMCQTFQLKRLDVSKSLDELYRAQQELTEHGIRAEHQAQYLSNIKLLTQLSNDSNRRKVPVSWRKKYQGDV